VSSKRNPQSILICKLALYENKVILQSCKITNSSIRSQDMATIKINVWKQNHNTSIGGRWTSICQGASAVANHAVQDLAHAGLCRLAKQ